MASRRSAETADTTDIFVSAYPIKPGEEIEIIQQVPEE